MQQTFLKACLLSVILVLTACRPQSRAEKLLNEAEKLIEKARLAEDEDSEKALTLYLQAKSRLEDIRALYPADSAGEVIHNGEPIASGFTFRQLKSQVIPRLRKKISAEKDPLACAEYLADGLPSSWEKAQLLHEIARKQLRSGQSKEAQQILGRVLTIARQLPPAWEKAAVITQAALDFANSGVKDYPLELASEALEIAQALPPGPEQNAALQNVARTCLELGAEQEGLAAIQLIPGTEHRQRAIFHLAQDLALRGLPHRALVATYMLPDAAQQAKFLVSLAEKTVREFNQPTQLYLSAALELLAEISDRTVRIDILLTVASLYRENGQVEQALRQIQNAAALLKEASAAEARLLTRLAGEQSLLGQRERAVLTVTRTIPMLKKIESSDEREALLLGLTVALAHARQFARANRLFAAMKSPSYRTLGGVELAQHYAEQERKEEALALLSQALKSAAEIVPPAEHLTTLHRISAAYLKLRKYEQATQIILSLRDKDPAWKMKARDLSNSLISLDETKAALALAEASADPYLKAVILTDLASSQAKKKKMEIALRLIHQAWEIGQTGNDLRRNKALMEYCLDLLLQINQAAEAQAIIADSQLINSSLWLTRIAAVHMRNGKTGLARETLEKAANETAKVKSLPLKIAALAELGEAYNQLGESPSKAVQDILKQTVRYRGSLSP